SSASSVSSTPSSLGGTSSGRAPARSSISTYICGISAAGSRQYPHAASSTYVVIPTTGLVPGSATLEHPLALVTGDDLVEEPLLRPCVVEVVVDDLVAEDPVRHRPALERRDRIPERMREAPDVRLVRVALERRA